VTINGEAPARSEVVQWVRRYERGKGVLGSKVSAFGAGVIISV
jgi:hypothetical protein